MKEKDISTIKDVVLEKIEKENIHPKSRWYFLIKNGVLWLPGLAVTLLGVLSVASIIFSIAHSGWEYRSFTHKTLFSFIVDILPLLWIVALAGFGLMIVSTLRLTSKGYKYKTGTILMVSILISVIVGFGIFLFDMNVQANKIIRFDIERRQKLIWNNPEQGRILGTIKVSDEDSALIDKTGRKWLLDTSEISLDKSIDSLTVRVVGQKVDDTTFLVCRALPWDLDMSKKRRSRVLIGSLKEENISSGRCSEIVKEIVSRRKGRYERNRAMYP